jgi:hypothetical protein
MSKHYDPARTVERARKALAYSIARASDARGERAARKAARLERVERRRFKEALRAADLAGDWA